MKKSISLVLTVILITSLFGFSSVFASTKNINVSTTPPGSSSGSITPDSVFPPSSTVNISDGSMMNFSGTAQISDLYLNNMFTGASKVEFYFHNYSDKTLTINLKKRGVLDSTVDTFTCRPNNECWIFDQFLNSSEKYYLVFNAPCEFDGWLQAY